MKQFKTIIVEDDAASLADLRHYLDKHIPAIDVVCVVANCSDAIDKLLYGSFQLSILDIELPDGYCFDIINRVNRSNLGEIIFATHHGGRFLTELIAAEPIYYLGKPFSKNHIQDMGIKIEEIFKKKESPIQNLELFKDHSGTRILINKDDILYIEYKGKTIFNFRDEKGEFSTATHRLPLVKQLERLGGNFIQCHKNYIININFLKEYDPDNKEGFVVKMPNNKTIVITKNFKNDVFGRKGVS